MCTRKRTIEDDSQLAKVDVYISVCTHESNTTPKAGINIFIKAATSFRSLRVWQTLRKHLSAGESPI